MCHVTKPTLQWQCTKPKPGKNSPYRGFENTSGILPTHFLCHLSWTSAQPFPDWQFRLEALQKGSPKAHKGTSKKSPGLFGLTSCSIPSLVLSFGKHMGCLSKSPIKCSGSEFVVWLGHSNIRTSPSLCILGCVSWSSWLGGKGGPSNREPSTRADWLIRASVIVAS